MTRSRNIATILALILSLGMGCSHGAKSPVELASAPPSPPVADMGAITQAELLPELLDNSGYAQGVLGMYTLGIDAIDHTSATLTPIRLAAAQGDEYALSVRPYMTPQSLKLLEVHPGPEGTTDYTLEFTHPFPMPIDLNRPASASKRVDLFIFDAQVVILTEGSDAFFGGAVLTDMETLVNPDGYRPISPLLDTGALGIAVANVFPYRLLHNINQTDPDGNYGTLYGWTDDEYLSPTGYDVIPQGATASTILRGGPTLPAQLTIAVVARYMDPRNGATIDEKRANRLPDPEDPAALRYYLPEACGDLQQLVTSSLGDLVDSSNTEESALTIQILDWDNARPVAASFPDPLQFGAIRKASQPYDIAASFPQLLAAGEFAATSTAPPTGANSQFVEATIPVRNLDQLLDLPSGDALNVLGLVRVRDAQDVGLPPYTLLDETGAPATLPPGFQPSTRYQRAIIRMVSGKVAPIVTDVSPLGGLPGAKVAMSATISGSPATAWSWDFGGGATPNTSTQPSPSVVLASAGTYNGFVTASNAFGSSPIFPFTLTIGDMPIVLSVAPSGTVGASGQQVDFLATTGGGAPTAWSWDFGGGATPNTSIATAPRVTLGIPGTYTGSVAASNSYGTSAPFNFEFTVASADPPTVTLVVPTGIVGVAGDTAEFFGEALGSPTAWSWNFGGGAIPNISSDVTPQVTLGTPGDYTGTLVAANAYGLSDPFEFDYTVAALPPPPTVFSVNPTGDVGLPGEAIGFSTNANGSPTSWNWSFGGGATPNTSSAAAPSVTLNSPGTYTGQVIATNGSGSSLPFNFEFTVELPSAPVISDVDPSGTVGGTGALVEFSATATNSPTSWSWNFGGGATPNTSTAAAPQVTLGATGTYSGTVTASNVGGTSPSFGFQFTVAGGAAPVISSVVPNNATIGKIGDSIVFGATASGNPTSWNWNFGGGAAPNTSTATNPQVVLGAGGTYNGTVTATNANGTSAPFAISYTVTPLATAWQTALFDPLITTTLGSRALIYQGKPAFLYRNSGLWLAMGSVAVPTSRSDWDVHLVTTEVATNHVDLIEYDGRLCAAFNGTDVRIALATVDAPESPADWNIHSVTPTLTSSPEGVRVRLGILSNGHLIVSSFYNKGIHVSIADTLTPTSVSQWDTHRAAIQDERTFNATYDPWNDMLVHAGRPIIAYQFHDVINETAVENHLRIGIATQDLPTSSSHWVNYQLDGSEVVGDHAGYLMQMQVIQGKPTLFYYQTYSTDYAFRFSRATTDHPGSKNSWIRHDVNPNQSRQTLGFDTSVTVYQGNPVIIGAYPDIGLRQGVALLPIPLATSDWVYGGDILDDPESEEPILLDLGSKLGMFYIRNNQLYYGTRD